MLDSTCTASPGRVRPRRTQPGQPDGGLRARVGGLSGWAVIAAGLGLVALAVQLYALSRHGYLRGITEYDDAVYLGAASRMLHGALPYRNFAFVAPPGVPLLMVPVALVGRVIGLRDALILARLLTALVTAVNVVLLGTLLRHRSRLTVLVACGLMAGYPATILSGRTLLLEPYLVLFCLLGAVSVFRGDRLANPRALLFGGLFLGFAGAMKVWAVIPLLAVVLVCLPTYRRRILPLAGGAAAGFAIPCLPFFLLAPRAFIRDVILVQLERSASRTPLATRLSFLTGAAGTTYALTIVELLALAALLVGVITSVFLATRRGLSPLERFAALTTVLVVLSFLWPDTFYYHYAAFLAPFVALLVGTAVSRVQSVVHAPHARGLVAACVGAVVMFNVNGVAFAARKTALPAPDPADAIDLVIPKGACVVTDAPALLVNANRFDARSTSCPDGVDPLGTTLSLNHGHHPSSELPDSSPAVRAVLSDLSRADYIILSGMASSRWPWTPTVVGYIQTNFVQMVVPGAVVFERRPHE
ncbi:MAG: phospholipid carrier-dependent glycosyltransferase [Acidimicrobiales bacterium]